MLHTDRVMSPAAARRLATATVLYPGTVTIIYPGPIFTRHQLRVQVLRPPGLPLTCGPRMTRAPSGFPPGLRTHADRTRARTPGQGQASSTSLELRLRHLRHAGPPSCEFTRTHVRLSCRTTTRLSSTGGAGPSS